MLHRKVQCWIFSRTPDGEERCLVLKTNLARGRFWQPVTGTVESNEGFFNAACREPLEETRFHFPSPPIDTGYEFDFQARGGPAREHVYALYVDGLPTPVIDPKEHEAWEWLSPVDALKRVKFPTNAEGLRHAFAKIFGHALPS